MASILLWNARGIKNKQEEIRYKTLKSNNPDNCGGIAIIVRNGIEFEVMEDWKFNSPNIEAIGISLKGTTNNYNLIAVYRKPYGVNNISICMSYVWNMMRVFKNVQKKINWNSWQHKNREQEIKNTIDELAPPWVEEENRIKLFSYSTEDNDMNKEFNMDEFQRAIHMIKRDSAPGLDSIDYQMLKNLPLEKCPAGISNFIIKWLEPRSTTFIINNQKVVVRKVYKGLPQGAVLSPILYALYTNKLTNNLVSGTQVVQFADDIAIYVQHTSRLNNRLNLETAVNRMASNLELLNLSLSPQKTNLVEFSKSGYLDRQLYITVKNTKIFNNQGARFLGIWLDNRIDFNKHIMDIRGRVNKANNLMKYLSNVSRGIEVNTALILYKSLVRSVIDYGLFIYYPCQKSTQLKLERCQFLGIRTALGYRNSTPNNVIIAESKVVLIKDRAKMLAKNFCSKIYKYGESSVRLSLDDLKSKELFARYRNPSFVKSIIGEAWDYICQMRNKLGNKEDIFEIWKYDYRTLTDSIAIDYEAGLSVKATGKKRKNNINTIKGYNAADRNLISTIKNKYNFNNNSCVVYTDGSKSPQAQSVGAGIVFEDQDEGLYISLPKQCTIFTAEAMAILSAMKIAESKADSFENFIILTDAKSVLQAINNNVLSVYHNKYILEIRRLHSRFKNVLSKKIMFVWIPSHCGISGNEIADWLAKAGADEPADTLIEVPISDCRSLFREEAWNDTQVIIVREASFKGVHYFKNYYDKDSKSPWFLPFNEDRYFVTMINRLRANHYNLNASLARKGYIEDARCVCGYEVEDFDHVVWRCHRYDEARMRMGDILRSKELEGVESISDMLKREKWEKIRVIFNFIKKLGRII
ncbi:uncharacterized protein LOC113003343 [Solenopsis invicta]|uniref:uncharacterized protein LOC113003343 n=1 Tax=Solenopsis invicta TaxID=13686 RepID=UPI00193C999E|nr:uncharacterized protein LOC113003343 [Solenopsis invicta]